MKLNLFLTATQPMRILNILMGEKSTVSVRDLVPCPEGQVVHPASTDQ